ncbi:hypothetical protein FGIG_11580 [Fasciola gigantica]|uniref:UPAR/Ly6 domain-containing protein n=1 Tax=Fasciola gigantica TaxID=46835 RepID=A0A504Y8S3_FASGI|nr:hypothetical protein FGIG_11580 [Fasciola gigantica]
MFRKFVALLTVFFVCPTVSDAVQCYSCTSCPIPFVPSTSRIRSSCSQCEISQTLVNFQVQSETRGCVSVCTPQNNVVRGFGARTDCCSTHLCNEKYNTSNPRSLFNFTLLGLITISLSKIQM